MGIRENKILSLPIIPIFHDSSIPALEGSHIGDNPRKHQSGNHIEGDEDKCHGAGPPVGISEFCAPVFHRELQLTQDGGRHGGKDHHSSHPGVEHIEVFIPGCGHHVDSRRKPEGDRKDPADPQRPVSAEPPGLISHEAADKNARRHERQTGDHEACMEIQEHGSPP